jgi:hypothetical protein
MKCLFAITPTIFLATSAAVASPDFARDVAPILERHCLDCHGPEKQSGGTRYDQREAAFGAGDSGGISPSCPGSRRRASSSTASSSTHKDERMPPKGERLSIRGDRHDP